MSDVAPNRCDHEALFFGQVGSSITCAACGVSWRATQGEHPRLRVDPAPSWGRASLNGRVRLAQTGVGLSTVVAMAEDAAKLTAARAQLAALQEAARAYIAACKAEALANAQAPGSMGAFNAGRARIAAERELARLAQLTTKETT